MKILCRASILPLVLALLLGAAEPASAQSRRSQPTGPLAKVAGDLLEARQEASLTPDERAALPQLPWRKGLPAVVDGRVRVEVRVASADPTVTAQLEAAGLQIEGEHLEVGRVTGTVDLDRLEAIALLPQVARIVALHPPVTHSAVISQGAAAINADPTIAGDAQQVLVVNGTGTKVGVLSDSLNDNQGGTESGGVCTCATPASSCLNLVTGMTNQTSGELPASIEMIQDSAGADEGSALAEIVYDIATGSGLMFATAFFGDQAGFAANIDKLVNCGADVIVDDVQYFAEPMFQDGLVAQAAQRAVDAGVPYFSAAGNQATFGVIDNYLDINSLVDDTAAPASGNDLHDFVPGGGTAADSFAKVTFPASPINCVGNDNCRGVTLVLQWSEPFDAPLGPGASSDLDLLFYAGCTVEGDPSTCSFKTGSTDFQGCGENPSIPGCEDGVCNDPLEILEITNQTTAPLFGFFAVEHFCGNENVELRIASFPLNSSFPGSFDFEDGGAGENPVFVDAQIFGHAAAQGVVAVAATKHDVLTTVEPFSSLGGPLPFYFAGDGTPLSSAPETATSAPAPTSRFKPDVTAPDGVSTTTPGFTTFFGTSAAAPHGAGVAALMLQATSGNISGAGVKAILEAAPGGDPEAPGVDPLAGFGLIDGLNSSGSVADSAPAIYVADLVLDLNGGAFVIASPTASVKIRASNSISFGDGNYSNVDATAPAHIFTDGFESGDTSSWRH